MELELNSLKWNVNEPEHELELEDMKRTTVNDQLQEGSWLMLLLGPGKSSISQKLH